ncbi:MAG: hypothetical protein ACOX6V_01805 [Patescibacteria group bacterium]|jgi:hypothetical protein
MKKVVFNSKNSNKKQKQNYETSKNTQGEQETSERLEKLARQSKRIIFKVNTVPFLTFFSPTRVVIDEEKVTVVNTTLFGRVARKVFPILFSHLLSARTAIEFYFFARLELEIKGMETNPESVGPLKKDDAAKARKVINGLIVVTRNKVDLSPLSTKEVLEKLEEIGRTE